MFHDVVVCRCGSGLSPGVATKRGKEKKQQFNDDKPAEASENSCMLMQ